RVTEPQQDRKLLLVDGHSLAYRAFFALPVENFSTTTGQSTNAVYGFTSMLINTLRDEKPTHLAVAFDVSRKTFRTELFPEYKANRSASPSEFKGQVDLIVEVLDAMKITSLRVDGFEADDILATLTTEAVAEGFDVLLLTGDRDAFQLVSDQTTVLYPKKGVSDLARMGPAEVEERYGLTPAQYPDFAALRGDPSDNLPNIPSVGEKTATKWIREYGSLDDLLANAESVGGKVGVALREHIDQVRRNRELTELVRDVPLAAGVADLERTPVDVEQVHEVFDALQFKVLRDRLFDLIAAEGGSVPTSHESADDIFAGELARCDADGELAAWLAARTGQDATPVALSFDGASGAGTGEVLAVALAAAGGDAVWFDPAELGASDDAAFAAWLSDPAHAKVMHSAKGAMLAFGARGLEVAGLAADIELSAYLVLAGQRALAISDLVERFLHTTLPTADGSGGQLTFDVDDGAANRDALAAAARAILALSAVLDAQIVERGGQALLSDVELPLVTLLAQMERDGICLDIAYLEQVEAEYAKEIAGAEASAHELAGRVFNLGSPKQLQEVLFGERGLPKTKKTKTGFTTDAEALQWLAEVSEDPLPVVLLRWREVTKLRQTVAGLLPLADSGHRIHTTFQQTVAATGRLSSTDPNLQNIPIRTEEGRRIRAGFVVGEGYETLLTADYSQIEMRIMAHLSGDEKLIATFVAGEDLHSTMAAEVFGVDPEDVDAEQRRRIKAMSYGLAYGLSAFGLSQQLGISAGEANGLMEKYFERFGAVSDYLTDAVDLARQTGYTETILGRRRYLPDLNSDNRQRREMAERMALNAPIQGSAADLVKVAMLNVDRAIRTENLASRLLLQVHDELILEVGQGESEQVSELVREQMAKAADLSVPLSVSIGLGHSWHEAAH
ncbi:MAG: DNA polymerase I, partial [Candidatus Nanopelagicales bacterium]